MELKKLVDSLNNNIEVTKNPVSGLIAFSADWAKKEGDEENEGAYLSHSIDRINKYITNTYASFNREEAKKRYLEILKSLNNKTPFILSEAEQIDKEELNKLLGELDLISKKLDDSDDEQAELKQLMSFLKEFNDKGYSVKIEFSSKMATWEDFTLNRWFNIEGETIKGFEEDIIKFYLDRKYEFNWDPIKSKAKRFIIYIFDEQEKDKWYLKEDHLNSSDFLEKDLDEICYKGSWGLLKYINKMKNYEDFEDKVVSEIAISHLLEYREANRKKEIKINVKLTFDPPLNLPPKWWWNKN